jgi:hypothetical protein
MLRAQRRSNKYQFHIFALTCSGLESTIYHTQGEHANHYTTDAVVLFSNYALQHKEI